MLGYAVGLVLPCASVSHHLLQRPRVWDLLVHELERQLLPIPSGALQVWWICADAQPTDNALAGRLSGLLPASLRHGFRRIPSGDLDRWLRHSQAVIHLRFPQQLHGTDPEQQLLNQRLQASLAGWQTIDLVMHADADRLSDQQRYWGHNRGTGQDDWPSALRGAETLLTPPPRARSKAMQRASDRRLLWQAALLALLVVGARHLSPALAPSLLVLLAGAWLMARQPLRQGSQQWWCLEQLLWVQDTWHRFALRDCPAERLPALPFAARGRGALDLRAVLRSHQLWLWMLPESPPWGRLELVDSIEAIRERQDQLSALMQLQRWRQRLVQLLLAIAAVLAVVAIKREGSQLMEELLLVIGVAIVAIGLATPVPMVPLERLRHHLRLLEEEGPELGRAQRADALAEPNLRASVEAALQRLGLAIVDLCDDALRAAQDHRRWLP